MNLLLVASGNFFADYGGGQVYVRRLVTDLRRPEYGLSLSVLSVDDSFADQTRMRTLTATLTEQEATWTEGDERATGVTVYEMSPRGDMGEVLRRVRPDLVHAHGHKAAMARACREAGVPCLVTAHHGGLCCPAGTLMDHRRHICNRPAEGRRCLRCYLHTIRGARWLWPLTLGIPWRLYINIGIRSRRGHFIPLISPVAEAALAVQEKMERWRGLCLDATRLVAPSQAMADALIRNGAAREKVQVEPHGVPTATGYAMENEEGSKLRFYYCGRMAPVKGVDVLLQAWRQARREGLHEAELHLIGTAGTRNEARYLRRCKRRSRGDSSVVWHGKVGQPEAIAHQCQVLLHPALYLEAFGLDMAEALAAGRWVIASRCGGAEQQIVEEQNGWLLPTGDRRAWAKALLRYATERPRPAGPRPLTLTEHALNLRKIYDELTPKNNPICYYFIGNQANWEYRSYFVDIHRKSL